MTGSTSNSATTTATTTATNTACAACKYQRRKCSPDCPLSPYFPPDQPKRFANVHKLFGVSNILRLLKHVDASKREDTVKSIAYEADTREKDPVHGCLGVIAVLQSQVAKLREDLHMAREQLFFMEQQRQHAFAVAVAGGGGCGYGHGLAGHQELPASPFEGDDESQFLRHQMGIHEEGKFDHSKLNAAPVDYRYGGGDDASLLSNHMKRRTPASSYLDVEPAFDESPVSHHQMHQLQAALDEDNNNNNNNNNNNKNNSNSIHAYSSNLRTSSSPAGYSALPPEAAATTADSFSSDHEEFRRAGVFLSLTNQRS